MAVLAIDQGTSATKAVVVCPDRGLLAEVDEPVEGARFDGDAVEQDPELLWRSVVAAGRRALAAAGEPVEAVGVGNQGETVLAWDLATGRPLTTAVSWQDRRAAAVTERVAARHPDAPQRIRALTGAPLDPYFAGPKQAWLAEHLLDPADARSAGTVTTTIDAFVLHRLTGAFVTDAATASRTLLLDPATLGWSAEVAGLLDLDPARLPEVVACDATVGRTRAFGPDLPVAGLIVDQQAALFAEDCRRPGAAKCTYGTGAFLLANVGREHRPSAAGLATTLAWAMDDGTRASCVDGQVYSVGAAVTWLQRVGLIAEPADLDRLGTAVPDAGGVAFVPSLAGMGAPVWDPAARGSFSGLALSTTREHLVRAFAEGIAAAVTLLAEAVATDLGRPLDALRVDGGLTRSALVMQAQADQLGIPVEVYPHACATALGVAALTLRARHGPGAEDAVVAGWRAARVFEPAPDRAAALDALAGWRRALDATRGAVP